MAFHLVDRIRELEPGGGARGSFTIPRSGEPFPPALLAEAIGQLASWVTMAQLDFQVRPVAALAGEVLVCGDVGPGDEIDLRVNMDGRSFRGVVYSGTAARRGEVVLSVSRCVGPLLPMAEFDDAGAVRERCRRLCTEGIPGGFEAIPPCPLHEASNAEVEIRDGAWTAVSLAHHVPERAPFFADHFPRKPVYPATVLLERKIWVAKCLLAHRWSLDLGWRVRRATHVKVSAFLAPGETVVLCATPTPGGEQSAAVQVTGRRDGVQVSRVRLELVRDPP